VHNNSEKQTSLILGVLFEERDYLKRGMGFKVLGSTHCPTPNRPLVTGVEGCACTLLAAMKQGDKYMKGRFTLSMGYRKDTHRGRCCHLEDFHLTSSFGETN
jgi:hypothetical protein